LELQQFAESAVRVILIAPTRALQHWVYGHYFGRILQEWQTEDERVRLITINLPPEMDDEDFDDRIPDDLEYIGDVTPQHQETWRRVLDRLKPQIGEEASNWLRYLELHEVEPLEVALTLVAPTKFIQDWVTDNYLKLIFEVWQEEDERVRALIITSPPSLVRPPVHQNAEMSDLVVTPRSQKNHGGRAPRFDWEALWFELIRIAQIDGFNSRRELRQRTLDWIATNWIDQPSESVLREKLSRLSDILNLPPN
jgi:chromosomal replication initiation ATPase DnaA